MASLRWCLAQVAVLRLDSIFPASETKRRSFAGSLKSMVFDRSAQKAQTLRLGMYLGFVLGLPCLIVRGLLNAVIMPSSFIYGNCPQVDVVYNRAKKAGHLPPVHHLAVQRAGELQSAGPGITPCSRLLLLYFSSVRPDSPTCVCVVCLRHKPVGL